MAARPKPRQIGKSHFAGMHVHLAVFGAACQRGYDLFRGVEQAGRSKARSTARKGIEVPSRECKSTFDLFSHTHPCSPVPGASNLHAQLENGGAELLGARSHPDCSNQTVSGDDGAIAGMEHVGAAQAEIVFHLLDGAKHARQVAPGIVPSMQ